jgi:hypothetical protein
MKHERLSPKEHAAQLHNEEEREKATAAELPEGEERDRHRMKGERLSDEAWAIEEAYDLEPRPSGLWPDR